MATKYAAEGESLVKEAEKRYGISFVSRSSSLARSSNDSSDIAVSSYLTLLDELRLQFENGTDEMECGF